MTTTRLSQRYGPWAVVTGASSGIGRAIALRALADGLNVVAAGRDPQRLSALTEAARECEREIRTVVADFSHAGASATLLQTTNDLDVGLFVAAAGFGTSGAFLSADLVAEREMLEVNCAAVLHQTSHFARRFAERRRGGIVLLGSLVGRQGVPNSAHYAATKAYVQTLGEGLHLELAAYGVDVLVTTPGPVHSGFAARADMRMTAALDPDVVARETLAALGKRMTVVPGALSKTLTWSLAPLPRSARVRIMATVMGKMTKHQRPR